MNPSPLKAWLGVLAAGLFAAAFADAAVPPVSTQGNRVLFGGVPGSIAGPSLFWSNDQWGGERFYTPGAVATAKRDWNATLIRAAMGVEDSGGYLQNPAGNTAKVRRVVEEAIANDMYVIIDWHSHNAERHTASAVQFFRQMAQDYGRFDNVIYEIYNEPLTVPWSTTIKPYAETVIAAIRAVDPDNLIIVGTPRWSQDVDAAANDPITGHRNIAYTLHFYAGTHGQDLRNKAQYALDRGIPLFVTEWGSVNADGNGGVNAQETANWMAFLRNNQISHANWALNDKSEGASALRPGANPNGGWTLADYTPSGLLARDIVRNWPPLGAPGPGPGPGPAPVCPSPSVPVRIEAEAHCTMSGIQTEATTDVGGGRNVGWIDGGDWMAYAVTVPTAGRYRVTYRVAAPSAGGRLRLERTGGSAVFGELDVPATGGWQAWTDASHEVSLPSGRVDLAIAAVRGGWNINAFRIDPVGPPPPVTRPALATMQAEAYSYMSGIQTGATSDVGGGLVVGWIDPGDWLSYVDSPIVIPATGTYEIRYRVSSAGAGGSLRLEEAGGSVVYGSIAFPGTGGWERWTTVSHRVVLPAGPRRFGIAATAAGWNLNWFEIHRVD
ncbi:hypothetical protein GCM10028794_25000 [Silanimonas algicola]